MGVRLKTELVPGSQELTCPSEGSLGHNPAAANQIAQLQKLQVKKRGVLDMQKC